MKHLILLCYHDGRISINQSFNYLSPTLFRCPTWSWPNTNYQSSIVLPFLLLSWIFKSFQWCAPRFSAPLKWFKDPAQLIYSILLDRPIIASLDKPYHCCNNKLSFYLPIVYDVAGKNKSVMDPFKPIKDTDMTIMRGLLNSTYKCFVDHVKNSRGDRLGGSKDIFSGEFWTGEKVSCFVLIKQPLSQFSLSLFNVVFI